MNNVFQFNSIIEIEVFRFLGDVHLKFELMTSDVLNL